jgi:hypothetical protein
MPLPVYMDVHVPAAITAGLRRRGIDVLTSQEDGSDVGQMSRCWNARRSLVEFSLAKMTICWLWRLNGNSKESNRPVLSMRTR